jgi:hypothetical protein
MNSKFLKLILTSASVLALAAVTSFAAEPAKKDGEKCPCPSENPKPTALVSGADCPKKCDKDKKDAPAAPATAQDAPAKKDCDKCPCPSDKPKPTAMLCGDECPKKCDKDKKDAPAAPATALVSGDDCPKKCDKDKKDAPAAPATAEDAPAKKDGEKCPCPSEKPKA